MNYHAHIRQIIFEYYETTDVLNTLFENEEDKSNYIAKMKTDKEYGTGLELETFSNNLKIFEKTF